MKGGFIHSSTFWTRLHTWGFNILRPDPHCSASEERADSFWAPHWPMSYMSGIPQWRNISGINAAWPLPAWPQPVCTEMKAPRHQDESKTLRFEHELQRAVRSLRLILLLPAYNPADIRSGAKAPQWSPFSSSAPANGIDLNAANLQS